MSASTPDSLIALVVDPETSERRLAEGVLQGAGFRVIALSDFSDAKRIVQDEPPDVLIAEIRLGEYNGLQLVIHGQQAHPFLAAVVTSRFGDPVLQSDADQIGATFVPKPTTERELLAAVIRTLVRQRRQQSGEPLRPPFERRQIERRTTLRLVPGQKDRRSSGDRRTDGAALIRRAAWPTSR